MGLIEILRGDLAQQSQLAAFRSRAPERARNLSRFLSADLKLELVAGCTGERSWCSASGRARGGLRAGGRPESDRSGRLAAPPGGPQAGSGGSAATDPARWVSSGWSRAARSRTGVEGCFGTRERNADGERLGRRGAPGGRKSATQSAMGARYRSAIQAARSSWMPVRIGRSLRTPWMSRGLS